MDAPVEVRRPGIHVLAKPIGAVCDIACEYCYYLEKRELYRRGEHFKMPDEVLARHIEQYIAADAISSHSPTSRSRYLVRVRVRGNWRELSRIRSLRTSGST